MVRLQRYSTAPPPHPRGCRRPALTRPRALILADGQPLRSRLRIRRAAFVSLLTRFALAHCLPPIADCRAWPQQGRADRLPGAARSTERARPIHHPRPHAAHPRTRFGAAPKVGLADPQAEGTAKRMLSQTPFRDLSGGPFPCLDAFWDRVRHQILARRAHHTTSDAPGCSFHKWVSES